MTDHKRWSLEHALGRALALDPGFLLLARGVRMVIAIACAQLAARSISGALDIENAGLIPFFSSFTVFVSFLLSTPSNRLCEARDLSVNAALLTAVMGVGAVVDWTVVNAGDLPLQIVWALAISLALYARRYGPRAAQGGIVVALGFMFLVLASPSPREAVWLMAGAPLAGAIGIAVNTLAWRPSALRVFLKEEARFRSRIAHALVTPHHPAPTTWESLAQDAWSRLTRAARLAGAECPGARPSLAAATTTALRLQLALRLIEDADDRMRIVSNKTLGETRFSEFRTNVSALVSASDNLTEQAADALHERMSRGRDRSVTAPGFSRSERFHAMRALTGLMAAVNARKKLFLDVGRLNTRQWPVDARPAKPQKSASIGEDMGWRLGLQGLVASAVTVALGDVFHLNHAYWATMTVFFVLNASLGATVRHAVERVLGTVVGVIAGLAMHPVIGQSDIAQAAIVGVAALLVPLAKHGSFVLLAGLVGFIVPMVVQMLGGGGIGTTFAMVYETALGASTALLVAAFVFPIRAGSFIRPMLDDLIAACRRCLSETSAAPENTDADVALLSAKGKDIDDALYAATSEVRFAGRSGVNHAKILAYVNALVTYTEVAIQVLRAPKSRHLPDTVRRLEHELLARLDRVMSEGLEAESTVDPTKDILTEWESEIPLDGSYPARDASLAVSELYYGRKVMDTLNGMRVLFKNSQSELIA